MNAALERAKSFLQSLKNYLLTGGHLVSQEEANRRAAICVACHNNVACATARPSKGVCRSCGRFVEDVAIRLAKAALLQGRQTPQNAALKCCGICGCDNQLQIWFPTVPLGMNQDNVNAYPDFCFKKNLNL